MMAKKTKSATDLAIELLAALQADAEANKAELRLLSQDARDLQIELDAERVQKLNLQHENGKLRKKLARVTAAASTAYKELAEYKKAGAATENPAINFAGYPPGVMPCDGVEVHGNLGDVDPAIAMACATGTARWPSAHKAILNTLPSPGDPGTWAGMPPFGENWFSKDKPAVDDAIVLLNLPVVDKYGRTVQPAPFGAGDE